MIIGGHNFVIKIPHLAGDKKLSPSHLFDQVAPGLAIASQHNTCLARESDRAGIAKIFFSKNWHLNLAQFMTRIKTFNFNSESDFKGFWTSNFFKVLI